jgi:4-amino-4-deoxy-L-arabinose transferase-like glycosyltransferase
VIETTALITDDPRTSIAARIGWAILIAATLYVCYFSHLGAIGFVGPDEPRYAWIARDMAETGDWVTPRLYGKPWFEKPPLFYWGAALCFKLFGVSEAAARLPSAISALLATLAMTWLALRLYGAETARWLLLLFPTTVGMIGFSHAAATDMPFSAMLTIAMVCAAVVLGLTRNENTPILPRTPWLALILFGFLLGLAVLAKGPAAIILSGGAIFFWALFTKRWHDAFRLLHPVAIASFCLTALPWYILCARRDPDFFRIFIIEHNFKRYLTPEFQHIQPFWYYVPVLLVAVFPWVALLLLTVFTGTRHLLHAKTASPATIFLLCWSSFCLAFFSTSHSKLPGYILPALPAIGLLLSYFCASPNIANRKATSATLFLFAGLAAIAAMFLKGIHIRAIADFEVVKFTGFALLALLFASNGLLGWALLCRDKTTLRSLLTALGPVPILVVLLFAEKPLAALDGRWLSSKGVAKEIQLRAIPFEKLSVWSYENRGWRFGLNFYLHRQIDDWDPTSNTEAFVLSGGKRCNLVKTASRDCFEISLDSYGADWFVLHVSPKSSAGMLPDRRQPH